MPYCARCLTEYVEGIVKCEDCGAELLPGSPPAGPPVVDLAGEKDVKLVSIRTFSGGTAQMDADLARNILQTQGMPSLLQGESSAEVLPVLDIPLFVREEDVERAKRILNDYLDTDAPTSPEEADPTEDA